MGTRNLTFVELGGEYKVAQYGQWDGYPDGQGKTIVNFLKNCDINSFKNKVANCFFIDLSDKEKVDKINNTKNWDKVWPQFSRDHGGAILQMIYDSENGLELKNSTNFASDSLFCEWAYVVSLDKNKLEVFRGFNETPLDKNDRFFSITGKEVLNEKYHPVKLVATYDLDNLPTIEQMVSDCKTQEERDEENEN